MTLFVTYVKWNFKKILLFFMGRKPKKQLIAISFNPQQVGEQIARLRKAQGLTQLQLANEIGISRSSIADYESGKNRIYDEMLVRLASALNVTTDEILLLKHEDLKNTQPSLRFMKRILKINALPDVDKKFILKAIDTLVANAEFKTTKE